MLKIGYTISNYSVGSIGYADDITLISPSIRALYNMFSICSEFAVEWNTGSLRPTQLTTVRLYD